MNEAVQDISKVAIVRHGDYDFNTKRLNATGHMQMRMLGQSLKGFLSEEALAIILSSTAPRAFDSAVVLAEILKASIKSDEVLWSDTNPYRPENLEAAHKLIHSLGSNIVVVVTHLEYVYNLPSYLCRTDLGEDCTTGPIEEGEGILIDYRARSLVKL